MGYQEMSKTAQILEEIREKTERAGYLPVKITKESLDSNFTTSTADPPTVELTVLTIEFTLEEESAVLIDTLFNTQHNTLTGTVIMALFVDDVLIDIWKREDEGQYTFHCWGFHYYVKLPAGSHSSKIKWAVDKGQGQVSHKRHNVIYWEKI